MARIDVRADGVDLDEPLLVEGFPGVGLVGKIAVDHLVESLDAVHYANVHCERLPDAAAYAAGDRAVRTPVRLYAAPGADLLLLQSDVPVSPEAAREFAACVADWLREESVTPLYVAGLRREEEGTPRRLFGVETGGADPLDDLELAPPEEAGLVSGPTGALLAHALETDLPAVGLIAEADPGFPDPTAARLVLEEGVAPLAGRTLDVDALADHADAVEQAKQRLARRLDDEDELSSQATPLRMYQ